MIDLFSPIAERIGAISGVS